jgi:hypothetical protein
MFTLGEIGKPIFETLSNPESKAGVLLTHTRTTVTTPREIATAFSSMPLQ